MAHSRRGFSLIELLVVIAIIGILAAILIPNLLGALGSTKETQTKMAIENIRAPMDEYKEKSGRAGRYPDRDTDNKNYTQMLVQQITDKGLFTFKDDALAPHPDTGQPQVGPFVMIDGWQQPIKYIPWANETDRTQGKNKKFYDMWSAGKDEEFGNEDDICNWSLKQLGPPDAQW